RDWLFSILIDNRSFEVAADADRIQVNDEIHTLEIVRDLGFGARPGAAAQEGPARLKPPIPGLVVSVEVGSGDDVVEGQTVVILEAMKMQMELKAPRSGRVSEVLVRPKQEVSQSQVLLVIGD
ncbi:MAG: acetyl-CoA carboxylase biotin carboxyl carrier protein subunit, partial [Chloroflexota bacterium]|nr:acetyl-CoA carboxylase biotin carboxyl carrier protein subunit [Chloroflexota bacterium]